MGVGKGEWHVVRVAWGVVGCERTWRVGVAGRGLGLVVEVLVVPVSDQAALDKDWEGLVHCGRRWVQSSVGVVVVVVVVVSVVVAVVVVVVVVVVAGGATSPTTVKNTASPTAVTAAIPIAVGNSRSSQSLKPNGTRWKMKLKRQDETNETTRRRKTCTHKTKKRRKRRRRRKRKARNEKTNKRTKKGKKGKTRRLKNVTWFCYSPNTFVWPGPKQSYMC